MLSLKAKESKDEISLGYLETISLLKTIQKANDIRVTMTPQAYTALVDIIFRETKILLQKLGEI